VHKLPLASRFSHLASRVSLLASRFSHLASRISLLLILALSASPTCTAAASAVAVDAVLIFVASTAFLITSLTLFVCVRGGGVCVCVGV